MEVLYFRRSQLEIASMNINVINDLTKIKHHNVHFIYIVCILYLIDANKSMFYFNLYLRRIYCIAILQEIP